MASQGLLLSSEKQNSNIPMLIDVQVKKLPRLFLFNISTL